jgi:hypothetical protein
MARRGAWRLSDWDRVAALFHKTVDLDPAARELELTRAALADPAIVGRVRRLLAAHSAARGFLERPAWVDDPALLREAVLAPDTRVGHYRILDVLGEGGMGVVYAAEDTRLGRLVALKAPHARLTADPVARERLVREAKAAAALAHPSIASVYALEEIDGRLFIASELLDGSTLRQELSAGPLPPDRLIDTLAQIADALAAAHGRGFVHRDLKPENVLRTREGRVKVIDFGLARDVAVPRADLTATGASLGTPGYMSPEQLRGQAVDTRSDVFAFGVMAWELATGRHPFGGGDAAALVERLLAAEPPLARALDPAWLDAIVRRCLRGDPSDRFASGVELSAALRAADDSSPRRVPHSAWWWQFHQVSIVVVTIAAVAIVGAERATLAAVGSPAFVTALAAGTTTVTLRLHLLFTSLVHAGSLRAIHRRSLPWIGIAEVVLAGVAGWAGSALVGAHEGTAAALIVMALVLVLSLAVIEPATTRASIGAGPGA